MIQFPWFTYGNYIFILRTGTYFVLPPVPRGLARIGSPSAYLNVANVYLANHRKERECI